MLQRVSKELAIRLKAKTVDIPTDMMYHNGELTGVKMDMYSMPNRYEGYCGAPYLDEVCKVFRDKEEYDIAMSVYVYILDENKYYSCIVNSSEKTFNKSKYNTHEQAQVAGINKALDLI